MTVIMAILAFIFFFFFNDTATTEIYTLSLHDALPISRRPGSPPGAPVGWPGSPATPPPPRDRKSTRLNPSHVSISYAVVCVKKNKEGGGCGALVGWDGVHGGVVFVGGRE